MKKKNLSIASCALAALLAGAILLSVAAMPGTGESGYHASFIQAVEDIAVDVSNKVDNTVMYQLPGSIGEHAEISIIISLETQCVVDAYAESDRTMSLAEFSVGSTAVRIQEQVARQKEELLSLLRRQGIDYTTGQDYSTLLSGFELLINASDFAAVCKSLDSSASVIVGEEYHVAETKLVENAVNMYDTGIFDSSASGYDGSGMVVAVLDTGLDSNHSAFSVENFTAETLGLTYRDVEKALEDCVSYAQYSGLTVDDVYINEKVPYGFDYADNDPDVYSTHNNHGTHVSGVIVGKDDTITGVAPNAQLVSMKIFSDVMDTARSAWILAALEDCVVLGVDVINMSLGTACGFSRENDEEAMNGVYDKIRAAGISMVAAASNSYSSAYGSEANGNLGLTSNPDTGTVGSPGTYDGMMSVASISGVETPYILHNGTIIYFDESTNGASEENSFFDTLLGDEESRDYDYVVIPGVGRSADYTGMDVTGKIVLVRRGSNTFEEKAMIAEAQGAAGIVIYNNVSGDIKMNVGDATLAVCSISQDDGEMLAAKGSGKLTISRDQTSGPFISDFSSWGPTPSLGIKPEITAHGGNILSAITGGSYDRLSGTSMACPNLSGVVVLLRQYVVENFPHIAEDNVAVNTMVNRLMMSTADIALNTNGLPYAVRKQGAGLASLINSIKTKAYVTTYDKNGQAMDKTKLELGDDPEKTGVYKMSFSVTNFGSGSLTYTLGAHVLTEGVSDTKTNSGKTTVTEEAYALTGATLDVLEVTGGQLQGKKLTIKGGETAEVTVSITLGEEDKAYLDASFANGMYVEGFLTLTAKKGTGIDLNVPYLAFYGDWTVAPLFDLNYYETNADELDDGIDEEDKTKADAYATRPIGGVEDDYVSYLGTYYFMQNPADVAIPASPEYISLSNQVGTIHSLRFVWAGLLRNAARIKVVITNDATGEEVFSCEDTDVRKAYGDGSASIYPANVEIEFDTLDYNLPNNSEYTVTLTGYLDYENDGAETNLKNTFSFPLTVDFEAPTLTDVEFYYEYDKTEKKNRLYAKLAIYDNHYAMAYQLGYVTTETDEDGNLSPIVKAFDQYMSPVYSQEDSTTYVTYELTDYIYEIKENSINYNSFVVTCYDYALNYATYEVGLPDEYVDFYFQGLEGGLTLNPNEVYTLEPLVYPETEWGELLEFTSSRPSVARVVNNKIVAAASGSAIIKVRDPQSNKSFTFPVTVLDKGDEGYRRYDKPVADLFRLEGYETIKAYYIINNDDKEIGDTGDIRFFEGKYNLNLYPSEMVRLNYTLDAYFPGDTTVEYLSSNEDIVTVDANGYVTAKAEGFASVTVRVLQDGRSTYYSETVSVEVKDPYITTGASLTHYYGLGGTVTIPDRLRLTEIGNFAFANFDYVLKNEEELAFDDSETSKMWFIGDSTITKVVIPEGVEKIGAYAFANLTALEEVVLPSTLEQIDYGAFYGCTSLEKLSFSSENNLKIINQNAFENCDLRGTLDLSAACVISNYAFAGNTALKGVTTGDSLLSIGEYAFAGCKKLDKVTITAAKVKYGAYAFTGCQSLGEFYVNAAVLPEGMFYECKAMTAVTIGPDVNDIGAFAFRSTEIAAFTVESGNGTYHNGTAAYILTKDQHTLVAVSPTTRDVFTAENLGGVRVEALAKGAFSHNTRITAVELPEVTEVGSYALASCENLTRVVFGTLTDIGAYAFFEAPITQLPAFTAGTQIGKYAFSYTGITAVTIPDGMEIAEGVFSECIDLTTVVIGNEVELGSYAFNISRDLAFRVESYTENGQRRYYYVFGTGLKSLTIGEACVIGENAFGNAASLEQVTLGAGAEIGEMAFYNNSSLKHIDLSEAVCIGEYAFSGDVYNVCLDDGMAYPVVGTDGYYLYTYHAPMLETVTLTAAEEIGEHAFSYCRQLTQVVLGEEITRIPQYAFAGCQSLTTMDLSRVETVEGYAFAESGLCSAELSAAEEVGEYAFVYCDRLASLVLNPKGVQLGEGAFAYCDVLSAVENMAAVEEVGDYAFAYISLTQADLTGAEKIGTHAFIKETVTPFTVILGEELEELGDNPFAMCRLEPFCQTESSSFNGMELQKHSYTYTLSDTVTVIDGSLYCRVPNGLELITYAGYCPEDVQVAEDTVRITAMAFAGSEAEKITTSYMLDAIGHKAFYGCDKLHTVVFGSYYVPVLEEEFDLVYYQSYQHIPGIGSYGTYTDYDGSEVEIVGTGLIPYYMWNVTDNFYSNVFYGANFVDYVGKVQDKLLMVRPVNGETYDSFIMAQYFDEELMGPTAPDDVTLAAIKAIRCLPERVSYSDKALVEAARAAYDKIATTQQLALVTNYAQLVSAEQRITALTPTEEEPAAPDVQTGEKDHSKALAVFQDVVMVLLTVFAAVVVSSLLSAQDTKAGTAEAREAEAPLSEDATALQKLQHRAKALMGSLGEKPALKKLLQALTAAGGALCTGTEKAVARGKGAVAALQEKARAKTTRRAEGETPEATAESPAEEVKSDEE